LRFQLQSPDGVPHEVDFQGRIVVVGRDPSCDLVLNDVKCSRRHAVIEAGPDGLTIRDSGSANGVYLNEQKIERAALKPGDVVRLGDSVIHVLPDEVEGTMVMGPAEDGIGEATVGDDAQPPPLPMRLRPEGVPPPLPRSAPPPLHATDGDEVEIPLPRDEPAGLGRPLTVSVLAALWLMSVPMYALGGLALAARFSGAGAVLTGLLGLLLAGLAAALAWGLWSLAPWARTLQIGVAGLGLLVCPFSLASIVVLAYLLTRTGTSAFLDGPVEAPGQTRMEAGFAGALLATVLLGALVTMLLLFLPRLATRLS
jgi:pSer/pThr/pTyr-binding forkhead associated (FHA) protein